MTARRAGTLAVALVGAGVLLAVLLVTWAASIGPSEVLRGDGPAPVAPTSVSTTAPALDSDGSPPPSGEGGNATLLRVVAIVLNAATAVLAVVLLAQLVRWGVRARRVRRTRLRRLVALGGADFDVIEPGAAVARELLAGSVAQRDALTGGTPRNAVVACWHRFELASAAAGIARREWETPSEHVIRVLDLVDADPASVSRLAGLYREARFSEHELTEADRDAAREALDAIHRSIGAVA
jgi:uncharacterized protein DUF4129